MPPDCIEDFTDQRVKRRSSMLPWHILRQSIPRTRDWDTALSATLKSPPNDRALSQYMRGGRLLTDCYSLHDRAGHPQKQAHTQHNHPDRSLIVWRTARLTRLHRSVISQLKKKSGITDLLGAKALQTEDLHPFFCLPRSCPQSSARMVASSIKEVVIQQ